MVPPTCDHSQRLAPFWARRGQSVIEVFRRDLVGGLNGWAAPDLSDSKERQLEFDQLQRAILVKQFLVVLHVLRDVAGPRLRQGGRIISEGMIGKKYSRGPLRRWNV
jgi:hypothetical protein